jgi:hypothetical protein
MKYHKQIHLHKGDKEIAGSCYPTVIACLLDKEIKDVPNFNILYWTKQEKKNIQICLEKRYGSKEDENYENKVSDYLDWLWFNVLEAYLYGQGLREQYIEDIDTWLINNKGKYYMATGISPRNVLHIVIYKDGKLEHDPHPSNAGLIKVNKYSYLERIL